MTAKTNGLSSTLRGINTCNLAQTFVRVCLCLRVCVFFLVPLSCSHRYTNTYGVVGSQRIIQLRMNSDCPIAPLTSLENASQCIKQIARCQNRRKVSNAFAKLLWKYAEFHYSSICVVNFMNALKQRSTKYFLVDSTVAPHIFHT